MQGELLATVNRRAVPYGADLVPRVFSIVHLITLWRFLGLPLKDVLT